jgi:hypothetical protein
MMGSTTQALINLRGHDRRAGKARANSFRFTGRLPGAGVEISTLLGNGVESRSL